MLSQRPVLMLLIPGRDALCLELSVAWPTALFAVVVLPFLSAMTARSYMAPGAAPRLSLGEATAGLSRAASPPPPLLDEEHAYLPEPARADDPGAGKRPVMLTSGIARAAIPEPQPQHREGVIDARSVKRAFALRRAPPGELDAERTVELSRGSLHLHAVHLGETVRTFPFDGAGRALAHPLAELRHLMRCRITGNEIDIDPRLVRILTQISAAYERPLQLISGYRTPNTLGTQPTSQHAKGRAADIRVRGVSLPALRKLAIRLGARGVGMYPEKGFLHVDVRPRTRYFWEYTSSHGETQYRPGE